jgi:hypothetical protein
MMHENRRCGHCGAPYVYQSSGHGCNRADNDGTYCPSCKTALNATLKTIPRVFECRYQPITAIPSLSHITLEECLAWEGGRSGPKRIWPALTNPETGDSQSIREVVATEPDGRVVARLRLSTWSKTDEYVIEAPMEWDLRENRFTGRTWR